MSAPTTHLLAVAVGPVQDFIAAARRTRDLWFGSFLLSQISKAAARAVAAACPCPVGDSLIFPAMDRPEDLDPERPADVPNVVLAQLPAGVDPSKVADAARAAAAAEWDRYAAEALAAAQRLVPGSIRRDTWAAQQGGVVEFYAAWVPVADDAAYPDARRRVMRLLAGRKACRDFGPAAGEHGVPKSSLDGARETVLEKKVQDPRTEAESRRIRSQLRLRRGEQLDVVGLTKRLAGGDRPYPSVSRVAADPWLRAAAARSPAAFGRLKEACAALAARGTVRKLGTGNDRLKQFVDFPYEGSIVYRSRHEEIAQENGIDDRPPFPGVDGPLAELAREFGEAGPYLAVLAADGDRMGESISRCKTAGVHRDVSRALSRFAAGVRAVVEGRCRGSLIYAGGDDVLAFLPLDRCMECARQLHDDFGTTLAAVVPAADGDKKPTLSVGIAIGHFLEPLEDLLDWARGAERAAKGTDRDGLAVHIHPRSGTSFGIRDEWGSAHDDASPDRRLAAWAGMLDRGTLPGKAAYDLRGLAQDYDHWPTKETAQRLALRDAIRADARRMLRRKRGPGGGKAETDALDGLLGRITTPDDLRRVARQLLVAQWLRGGPESGAGTAAATVAGQAAGGAAHGAGGSPASAAAATEEA